MNISDIYLLKDDFIRFGNTAKALKERMQPLMAMVSESDLDEMQCEALTRFLEKSSESCDPVEQLISDLATLTDICIAISEKQ